MITVTSHASGARLPAGAAAALGLARNGCSVALLERQEAPGWKIGETLPPEARVHLQRLEHWQTFRQAGHMPCHGIVSCWGGSERLETDFTMNPYGHGWQLDRVRFENDLLQAAREVGCDVFLGTEAGALEFNAGTWRVQTSSGEFHAQWVLDCSGRNSLLTAAVPCGAFRQLQDYVSFYSVLQAPAGNDQDGRTYVESLPSGWAYSALMPNGSRVIAFLTDRDQYPPDVSPAHWMTRCIEQGSQIKRLLSHYDYPPICKAHLVSAGSGRYEQFAGPHWILVGDAGMTFDPLSGWGSAKALVSAAEAVQTVLHDSDYQGFCEGLWHHYLRQYRDFYLAEQRWPDAPFWSRRHQTTLQ